MTDQQQQQQFVNIPLQQWIQNEADRVGGGGGEATVAAIGGIVDQQQQQNNNNTTSLLQRKQSLLRKTTVAYGIAKLLSRIKQVGYNQQHSSSDRGVAIIDSTSTTSPKASRHQCINISNFLVQIPHTDSKVGNAPQTSQTSSSTTDWKDDVRGVYMTQPIALYAEISEPSFLLANFDNDHDHDDEIDDDHVVDRWGRYLEVEITTVTPPEQQHATSRKRNGDYSSSSSSSDNECHLLGKLLYELFAGTCPSNMSNATTDGSIEPARKKSTVRYDKRKGKSYSTLQQTPNTPLQELGFPPSISTLVQNLMDGADCYPTVDEACSDIHLLLSDPECFLFDPEERQQQRQQQHMLSVSIDSGSSVGSDSSNMVQLHIKEGKLYGREKETSLITDTFCRVSEGNNEAFFIGGYSGSGKSMLVHSLTPRIDIAGGYVLEQKVDQMSKERPLLDVISAFNKLCLLIKERSAECQLREVSSKLKHEFESDFAVLARLLPNITVIFPNKGDDDDGGINPRLYHGREDLMLSLQNVCFILQRFMRIVSSKVNPVLLFLDDIHWAGSTSLELIQSLLCDAKGGCFMFVGSYRDNEVTADHPIFDLMNNIRLDGVRSTTVHLRGLSKQDLNQMIAEMLCMLPRLCNPLSDILTEKTEGNPYFLLVFLRSLVDRRLLKYSLREKKWIWDESKIRSEHITDNVLYLLSSKMTSLDENIQLVLEIISCFGIKCDVRVIEHLSKTPKYNGIENWINQAVKEGYLLQGKFQFVHDKVREAAYSLIPENEKSQFHFDLGMLLYSTTEGQDLCDTIFQIANQINHGVPNLIQEQQQVGIAEHNFQAGSRAMDLSDYEMAKSYLSTALSLLPPNHWSFHYDLSLKMYFGAANAAYTGGSGKKAFELLKSILENGRCIEDKLDAYYLYAMMHHTQEQNDEGYDTSMNVLQQLGETLPATITLPQLHGMMTETGKALAKMSDADIQLRFSMENSSSFRGYL